MILVVDNLLSLTYTGLTDEIARHLGDVEVVNLHGGETLPAIDDAVEGVVLTGSAAGVYEAETRPWIEEEAAYVCDLLDRGVPLLGICFGHQLVNVALGGRVERCSTTAGLVRATFDDDPLFGGVEPVVPVVHGDHVIERGEGMERIATAAHCPTFATRHRSAPVWTVQYHPELRPDLARERFEPEFGWETNGLRYADSTAPETLVNFRRLAARVRGTGDEGCGDDVDDGRRL
ncbi:MAG: type 1 glutamine amidotransferase [Haloplanus sp.]